MVDLLEIDSKPYGKVKVSVDQKIHFSEGLLGFDNNKDFFLLDENEGPFYWLQSTNETDIAFVIINPQYFKADYTLEIDSQDFVDIGLKSEEDIDKHLLQFAIVTIPPDDPNNMTANLLGPIIINKESRIGKQALSLNNEYSVRHNIIDELGKSSGEGE